MSKKCLLISNILAIVIFSIGVVVMIGWLLDISILKGFLSDKLAIKANIALCFILAGVSLWFINRKKQTIFQKIILNSFPWIIISTGLLTLVEYFFGINFGIDELLFRVNANIIAASNLGQMAPITALCFILSGIALRLLYKNILFQLFQSLSLIIFGASLMIIVGYLFMVTFLPEQIVILTKMAFHTATGLIILSVGMLCSRPNKGIMNIVTDDGVAGNTLRRLLPIIIFLLLGLGKLILIGEQTGYYDSESGVAIYTFSMITIVSILILIVSRNLLINDTKRKKDKKLLNKYKHFFINSNDFSCIVNKKGYFEIINPQFEKVLGYSINELLENPFLYFVHPDDNAVTLLEMEKLNQGDKTINFANRYRKKDGSYLWFDWNATPDPVSGEIYGIARDITTRKKIELKLDIIATKLKEAQALGKMGNWETNLVTNTNTWSEETFKILGVDPDTTIPSLEAHLSCIHPDDLDFVKEKINEVLTTLTGSTYNHRIIRKDGTIVHAISQSRLYFDENNKPVRLFGIIQDITEAKKTEEKLLELNQELESFSYSVSHDLRSPLRAINGYAQILHEDYGETLDTEGNRLLETIKDNALKMGRLIDDLLAFSRLGRKEIQKTAVDMNHLTQSVLDDVNQSTIHHAVIDTSKLHSVDADYGLLHQVMSNLILNAVKYSSMKKNPVVTISSKEENGEIIFSVKDNGVGFDMQYSDKLYGIFQRLHSQEEFEGTGVGLAIVKRIINKHGGKVWADGKVNEGANFYFSLAKTKIHKYYEKSLKQN